MPNPLLSSSATAINATALAAWYNVGADAVPEILATHGKPWSHCEFWRSVADHDGLPTTEHAEMVFAGRSNVGKSSLLNAVANHGSLAKVSGTPGCTRLLNYFEVNNAWWLVDVPGYGYARVSRGISMQWNSLLRDYLRGRLQLRRLYLLIDARHGVSKTDREFLEFLQPLAVSTQIVCSKIDKLPPADLAAMAARAERDIARYACVFPQVIVASARDSLGMETIRAMLARPL